MINKDYFSDRKTSILFVALLLIVGTILYFTTGADIKANMMDKDSSENMNTDVSLFNNIELKVVYSPEGMIKVFALAENNNIKNYPASTGNNIPEKSSIIIGSAEAQMMIEEKLFKKPGDEINDLFGIDVIIGGVLEPTGTFADDFHFLSSEQYASLNGDSTVLFVKFKDEKSPKLFYYYDNANPAPLEMELSDGSIAQFEKKIIDGKVYYPIIIGSKEADMMIEEKLFTRPGDTLEGFFDKNVIIVGIVKETNTALDMTHIVEKDFFEKEIEGVLV